MSGELPHGGPPDPIDFLRNISAGDTGENNSELIGKLEEALSAKTKAKEETPKREQDPPARERPAVSAFLHETLSFELSYCACHQTSSSLTPTNCFSCHPLER